MPGTGPLCLLVTGGAGYIGSHAAFELAAAGHEVVVLDNLVNGHRQAVEQAAKLSRGAVSLVEGDITSAADLDRAWSRGPFDAVLHFAALKSVEESVREPELYRRVNVEGTAALCEAMVRHGCKRLVFSSSAAVYGEGDGGLCGEDTELRPLSPYGLTKAQAEQVIESAAAEQGWAAVSLRYFNPVGSHPSGDMGEDPLVAANLAPVLLEVASGRRGELELFGGDYDTDDGTCIRDYIHIMDLASAHLVALQHTATATGHSIYNVGTGRGTSVLEILAAARRITGKPIPARMVGRRVGDIMQLVADPSRIGAELGWRASYTIDDMLESAWRWQQRQPEGYRGASMLEPDD